MSALDELFDIEGTTSSPPLTGSLTGLAEPDSLTSLPGGEATKTYDGARSVGGLQGATGNISANSPAQERGIDSHTRSPHGSGGSSPQKGAPAILNGSGSNLNVALPERLNDQMEDEDEQAGAIQLWEIQFHWNTMSERKIRVYKT